MKPILHYTREESKKFSRSFLDSLHSKFERSTFVYVDFDIYEDKENTVQIQVFYSRKSGFYSTRLRTNSLIRHAFGKWDKDDFLAAKSKSNPLHPLFIFDFALDYKEKKYESIFATLNGENHILTKIYDLSDKNFTLLNESYDVYKIGEAKYFLFDFGNYHEVNRFLRNLEKVVNELSFGLNVSNNLIIKPDSLNLEKREDSFRYCMMCGEKLKPFVHAILFDFSKKFPARCSNCLEKIYALDLYYLLSKSSLTGNTILLSEMRNLWEDSELFNYNINLLTDLEFLEQLSEDLYRLKVNDEIEDLFKHLLIPMKKESETKMGIYDILGIGEEDTDSPFEDDSKICKICGDELEGSDLDICSKCLDKRLAIKYISELVSYVKPGIGFSKSSLLADGFDELNLEIIISSLQDLNLLYYDSEDLIILKPKSKLNEFIEKYSSNPEEDILDDEAEEGPRQTIFKSNLKDENSLDKSINLIEYQDYVECRRHDELLEEWLVILKKGGEEYLRQSFRSPFQAKLISVRYLNEINVIQIIDDVSGSQEKKEYNSWEPFNLDDDLGVEEYDTKICVICGKEFEIKGKFSSSQKYCDECKDKYNASERIVLQGIKKGTFNKEMAIKAKKLQEEGCPKTRIANKLKLKQGNLVEPLIKFFLGESKEEEHATQEEENISISTDIGVKSFNDLHDENKIKRTCPICGAELFSPNRKYCEECVKKYDTYERRVIVGIKEGKYTKTMALKIKKLKDQNKTNRFIAEEVGIPDPYTPVAGGIIKAILKLYFTDEGENIRKSLEDGNEKSDRITYCQICGKQLPKGSYKYGRKYCHQCLRKYSVPERMVMARIKEGVYNEQTAIGIFNLKKEGYNNREIADILKLSSPTVIDPIIKFLLIDEYTDSNEEETSNEAMDSNSDNTSNVIFKGIVSESDYKNLFYELSLLNSNLNKFVCTARLDDSYDILIDFNISEEELSDVLNQFKKFGLIKS